jgi:hypothetical protein
MSDSEEEGEVFLVESPLPPVPNPFAKKKNTLKTDPKKVDPPTKKQKLDLTIPISKEEVAEKQRRIKQIKEYKRKFPTKCSHIKITNVDKMTLVQLSKTVTDIQASLDAASGNGSNVNVLVDTGLSLFEKVAANVGIKIGSLKDNLAKDSDWQDLLTEFEIKHTQSSPSPIEHRLVLKALKVAAALYKQNTMEEEIKTKAINIKPSDKEIDAELAKKYSDL